MRRLPRTVGGVGRSARPTTCRGAPAEIRRWHASINPFSLLLFCHVGNRRELADENQRGDKRAHSWLPEFRAESRGSRRAREQTRGTNAMARRVSYSPKALVDRRATKRQLPAFLDREEIAWLTGFHRKGRQIEQLRRMGVAFFINGSGRPVVTRAAIEGRADVVSSRAWSPALVKRQH